jgi:myosin heavy subunit
MSKSTQATKQATQSAKKIRKAVTDNLVDLDEKAPERANPKELNNKINQIDTDLDSLRSELTTTNKGLKTSLSSLENKDTDLTTRVSAAYQKLGELDASYNSLTDKSANISREIKTITKTINEISQKTGEEIGTLSEGYQELIARTEELAHKSKLTTQNLNKSIKANAEAMKEMEEKLLSEIDGVDKSSLQRDESLNETAKNLENNLNKAEEDIRSSQAKMLKMQAVDQALEKRSEALEATTDELTKKSRELSRSTTLLNKRTGELGEAIAALQVTTEEHEEMIVDLQDRSEKTSHALVAAIMQEKRHFITLGSALGIFLLAFIGYMLYQSSNWNSEAENNAALASGVNSVNTDLGQLDNRVSGVQDQMILGDARLHREIEDINDKLTSMGDQVDSLDGRMNNIRPHRSFGNGNVINGPEWLATQSSKPYVIHLATVSEKKDLYKLAERYSHYLKDDLAYMPVDANGKQAYALLFGQFESETKASAKLSRMPRYIERQSPSVHQMGTIQQYISNNK